MGIDSNTQEVRILCPACHLRIAVQEEVQFSFITGGLIQAQCLNHGKSITREYMVVAKTTTSYEVMSNDPLSVRVFYF